MTYIVSTSGSRTAQSTHQRSARIAGIVALWTLLLVAFVPATVSATPSEESSFVAQVNATRANVGLPPLQVDSQLTTLARGWATSMRDGTCGQGNFICHASPISAGVTHNWAKLGENVGTGPDINSIMAAFIASPGHYANIVDPEFTHIGVGVVWDGSRMFTTHRFMKLQGSAPTTTAPTTTTTAPPAAPAPTTAAPAAAAAPTTAAPAPTTASSAPSAPVPTTAATAPTTAAPAPRERADAAQPSAVLEERAATVMTAITRLTR